MTIDNGSYVLRALWQKQSGSSFSMEPDEIQRRLSPRFTFALVGVFAGLAISLAAIGTYGVIAYAVSRRTAEFGLRVALGAQRMDLLRMVLLQSTKLTVPGIILGVLLALSLGRVVQNLVYGVSPSDPVILSTVVLLVLTATLIASYVPARRASHSDPMASLRAE